MAFGRKLTPVMIRVKLRNEGILASYMNCVNALDRLKVEFLEVILSNMVCFHPTSQN
uniref:Uncharacterized protein n=1 Tax=Hyaloperonospora arabidopsidis (strain Emoy2) TaxID=559515 RepID=M4B702_HYAAE